MGLFAIAGSATVCPRPRIRGHVRRHGLFRSRFAEKGV